MASSATPIARDRPFDHSAAWKATDFAGKNDFAIDLAPRHMDAFDAALAHLDARGRVSLEGIGRNDFPLAAIADDVRDWRREVEHGRGLVLLRGFPVDRYPQEDIERLWFGLGTHFGRAVSQSVIGDLLGHVVDVAGPDKRQRAYRNSRELQLHTDRCDTVGMFCLQKAWKGGLSGYASALAVHDEILATRPELLEPLWRGFHLHRFGEQPPGESPYSPVRVPVFSERDGVTTVIMIRGYIDMAADEYDLPITELERDALDTFHEIANRPEFRLDFMLDPGDAILFNNCAILHKRTAFEDHAKPGRERHLMRLWLVDWDGRRTVDAVKVHKGQGGIPRQEGRTPYYADRR